MCGGGGGGGVGVGVHDTKTIDSRATVHRQTGYGVIDCLWHIILP